MTRSMKDEQYDQFVSLFARYERSVRGFVRSLLPLLQDVDDVMQEVGLVCWRKFDSFTANDSSEDFVKWACVIARFEVLRHRRNCARDRLVLSEDVIEALAVDAEARIKTLQAERIAVEHCLKKLPDSERRLLLSVHNGDINTRQPGTDATALQLAATFGHVDIAKFLIEQGADVSAKDHNGNTALHAAVFMAFPEIVLLIKNAGESVQAKYNSGESPAELVLVPWEQDLVELYHNLGDYLGMKLDLQRIRLARPKIVEIVNN